MDIFVGSLPFRLKEAELKAMFEAYGEVKSAKIILDKITRQNKGFGFVEMPNKVEAEKAINNLHESEVMGRKIIVNESLLLEQRVKERPFKAGNFKRNPDSKW
jgi:RNA recognition motif-containing protein